MCVCVHTAHRRLTTTILHIWNYLHTNYIYMHRFNTVYKWWENIVRNEFVDIPLVVVLNRTFPKTAGYGVRDEFSLFVCMFVRLYLSCFSRLQADWKLVVYLRFTCKLNLARNWWQRAYFWLQNKRVFARFIRYDKLIILTDCYRLCCFTDIDPFIIAMMRAYEAPYCIAVLFLVLLFLKWNKQNLSILVYKMKWNEMVVTENVRVCNEWKRRNGNEWIGVCVCVCAKLCTN